MSELVIETKQCITDTATVSSRRSQPFTSRSILLCREKTSEREGCSDAYRSLFLCVSEYLTNVLAELIQALSGMRNTRSVSLDHFTFDWKEWAESHAGVMRLSNCFKSGFYNFTRDGGAIRSEQLLVRWFFSADTVMRHRLLMSDTSNETRIVLQPLNGEPKWEHQSTDTDKV